MIKALLDAIKLTRRLKKEAVVAKMLTDDPLSVELIERIAKKYDYHFEIVQKDGTVLRFTKKTERVESPNFGVW